MQSHRLLYAILFCTARTELHDQQNLYIYMCVYLFSNRFGSIKLFKSIFCRLTQTLIKMTSFSTDIWQYGEFETVLDGMHYIRLKTIKFLSKLLN